MLAVSPRRVIMLAFNDATKIVIEPKTARMEQRTKPHVKETIEKAAALMGVDATAFVVSSAYDRAQQAIEAHERTVLTREDRDVFLSALDNPPAPTETLRNAFKLHDARVVKEK
jgi:uncharacterized protein (DUF1778 family)